MAPPSRQASNTSSVTSQTGSVVCGSENWESYTDTSETEDTNASDAYYAKIKAQELRQQGFKRPAQGMQPGTAKRMREQQTIVEEGMVREGSETAWTDDDIGECF